MDESVFSDEVQSYKEKCSIWIVAYCEPYEND